MQRTPRRFPALGPVKIFGIFGVSLRVHPLPLALLLTLAAVEFQRGVLFASDPLERKALTPILFLVLLAVVVHEYGHALIARWLGLRVAGITIHAVHAATNTEPPRTSREELLVAAGGPGASLLCALVLHLLHRLLVPDPAPAESLPDAVFRLAVPINLMLGGLNLFPAFPMDGGRMLRALISARLGFMEATRVAVWIGRFLALGLISGPLIFAFHPVSFTLPVIGVVLFVLGNRELRLAGMAGC